MKVKLYDDSSGTEIGTDIMTFLILMRMEDLQHSHSATEKPINSFRMLSLQILGNWDANIVTALAIRN